jgi:ADP-ribose pyrophosphatase YjhB (NUDIX family)
MVFDKTEYTKGYSIGVGGVVLYKDKALLVRRKRGSRAGDWAIPGGFVEHRETIDVAVKREVLEETGIEAQVQGLVAVRSRVIKSGDENSAYFIFQLQSTHDNAHADGIEVDEARFFNLQEILELSSLQELTRLVITKILQGEAKILTFHAHPTISAEEYIIYA